MSLSALIPYDMRENETNEFLSPLKVKAVCILHDLHFVATKILLLTKFNTKFLPF